MRGRPDRSSAHRGGCWRGSKGRIVHMALAASRRCGAGAAGDRPRSGRRRARGRAAGRGRGRAHRRSRATLNFWLRRHQSLIQRHARSFSAKRNRPAGCCSTASSFSPSQRRSVVAGGGNADRRRPSSLKKARVTRRAACCCRPTTRAQRWRAWPRLSARACRRVICLGDSFHEATGRSAMPGDAAALGVRWSSATTGSGLPAITIRFCRRCSADGRSSASSNSTLGVAPPSGGRRHRRNQRPLSSEIAYRCARPALERRLFHRRLAPHRAPAFGAYTGGLHIESEPIRALFPAAFRIDLLLRGQFDPRRQDPIAAAERNQTAPLTFFSAWRNSGKDFSDGAKIFEIGRSRCRARDEEAQRRHAQKRSQRQEG